jgi:hypothetical protein
VAAAAWYELPWLSVTDLIDADVSFQPMATTSRSPSFCASSVTLTRRWAVCGAAAAAWSNCQPGEPTVVVVDGATVVVPLPPDEPNTKTQSEASSAWVPGVWYGLVAGWLAPVAGSNHWAVTPLFSFDASTVIARPVGTYTTAYAPSGVRAAVA